MITVSDEYKQAIKGDVREFNVCSSIINTRVKSSLDNITSTNRADIGSIETLFDIETPYMYDYAVLEQDYFKLDGSFILPNRSNNLYSEFIATDDTCSLSFTTIQHPISEYAIFFEKGITITFDHGYATDFTVSFYKYQSSEWVLTEEHNITDNDKSTISVLRENDYVYSDEQKITITINEWSNSYFPKIKKVYDYGNELLSNDDIINVKMLEQTDLRGLSIPSNSFSITVDNYKRQYNILDKNNILNMFNDNSYIVAYIGLNIDGCYQYFSLGRYYYKSYKENSNKNMEFDFLGAVDVYKSYFPSSYSLSTTYTPTQVKNNILYGDEDDPLYFVDETNAEVGYISANSKEDQMVEALIYYNASIRQKRGSAYLIPFNIDIINEGIEDYMIGLDVQIRNPEFIRYLPTKNIKYNLFDIGQLQDDKTEIFNGWIDSIKREGDNYSQAVKIITQAYCSESTSSVDIYYGNTKIVNNGTLASGNNYTGFECVNTGSHNTIIELLSNVDKSGNYRILKKCYPKIDKIIEVNNKGIADASAGASIEINSGLIRTTKQAQKIGEAIFKYEKKYPYEFTTEIMGDIRLEVGDKIILESLDGNHTAIIESIDTTYNGGLTQIIKGVSTGVL